MQQLQKHKNTDIFQLVWLRGVHHTAESSDQNLSKNFAMCIKPLSQAPRCTLCIKQRSQTAHQGVKIKILVSLI